MFVPFKQGIVRQQLPTFLAVIGNHTSIVFVDTPLILAIAGGINTNYLVVISQSVPNAWTTVPGINQWLYFDINVNTAQISYGVTLHPPVFGIQPPGTPPIDKHWFDTGNMIMKVWNGNYWIEKIRVFACQLAGGSVPVSMGDQPPPLFTGTQAGINVGAYMGQIVYDPFTGLPTRKQDRTFLTTEDRLSTVGVVDNAVKLAAMIVDAKAQQNMAAYTCVKFSGFNEIVYADPFTTNQDIPFGMIQQSVLVGQMIQVAITGVIENFLWDWTRAGVNAPLFIGVGGLLQTTPAIPNQTPAAYVVSKTTILLNTEKKTIQTTVNPRVSNASQSVIGITKLSVNPVNLSNPIAVGDNDPRLAPGDFYTSVQNIIGASTINDLADVDTTGVTLGQVLTWNGSEWVPSTVTGTGTVTSVGLNPPPSGISVSGSPVTTAGRFTLTLTDDLAAVENLTTTGLTVRTSTGWNTRQIVAGTGIAVTNGTGILGDPTITLNASINDLNDVRIAAPALNQVLTWNGTNWINAPVSAGLPAGSRTQLQFNGGGVFAASPNLTWTTGTSTFFVNGVRHLAEGFFSTPTDAILLEYIIRRLTTNISPTELLKGGTRQMLIPANTTWRFEVYIVARSLSTPEHAAFKLTGCIYKDATNRTTTIIGTPAKVIDAQTSGALTWDVNAQADIANGALQIMATGQNGVNIRWVGFVKIIEVQ